MSDLLTSSKSFALEAEEVYDEMPEDLPRTQLTSRRHVALRRPDRLAGTVAGDAMNRSVWYDGKTISALDDAHNTYVRMDVSPTVDAAMDEALDRTGMVIPLADFLYSDVYDRLMGSVERGVYLGVHDVGGIPCHHLAFEQETIDWQLWIDAGSQPLPRKLVIAYKDEDEVPQYLVTIRKWNLAADVPDEIFHFEPPPGARKVDLPEVFGANAQPETPPAPAPAERKPRRRTRRRSHEARSDGDPRIGSIVFGQAAPLLAGHSGGGGRGSVSAASKGGSGGSNSWQGKNGNVSGSRTVTQTSSGYNVNKQAQTESGASKRSTRTSTRAAARSRASTARPRPRTHPGRRPTETARPRTRAATPRFKEVPARARARPPPARAPWGRTRTGRRSRRAR